MDRRDSPGRDLVVSLAIAGAMSASMVLYPAVAWFVVESGSGPGVQVPSLLAPVLTAMGLTSAVGGVVFFRGRLRRIRRRADTTAPPELRARLLGARIVGLAMVEVLAIFGLILTLLTGELWWSLGSGGLALAASLLLWPTRRQLAELSGPDPSAPIEPS